MKTIPIPESREDRMEVIQSYFYGGHPHFQSRKNGGKSYPAYHVLPRLDEGDEPNPAEVIAEHVDGERVWACRAMNDRGAQFAALDVDTTDDALLRAIRERLDDTYGPELHNWERSATGVHVWFLWDGSVRREYAIQLVNLLSLDESLSDAIDNRYPEHNVPLRLPFPGQYDPVPPFNRNTLSILDCTDFNRLLDASTLTTVCECLSSGKGTCLSGDRDNDVLTVPDTTYCPRHYRGYCLGHCITHSHDSLRDHDAILTDTSLSMGQKVMGALSIAPEDGNTYATLITNKLLTLAKGWFGPEEGRRRLKEWIRSGNPKKVSERLEELNKYEASSEKKGFKPAVSGPLCREDDLRHFEEGMFSDELQFVGSSSVRAEVERCLFVMLVCEQRSRIHNVDPWYISTRAIAELMRFPPESGRKRVGSRLSFIVEGLGENQYPAFRIVQQHTVRKARRYRINPEYEYLLNRLPDLDPLPKTRSP